MAVFHREAALNRITPDLAEALIALHPAAAAAIAALPIDATNNSTAEVAVTASVAKSE